MKQPRSWGGMRARVLHPKGSAATKATTLPELTIYKPGKLTSKAIPLVIYVPMIEVQSTVCLRVKRYRS